MKQIIFTILVFAGLFLLQVNAQTVIEMTHPDDADLRYLVVDDIEQADFVVYKTSKKEEYEAWDFMWNFKKWGFSNYAIYLTRSEADSLFLDTDDGIRKGLNGKIYFTENKEERGIRREGFVLEGILRKTGQKDKK